MTTLRSYPFTRSTISSTGSSKVSSRPSLSRSYSSADFYKSNYSKWKSSSVRSLGVNSSTFNASRMRISSRTNRESPTDQAWNKLLERRRSCKEKFRIREKEKDEVSKIRDKIDETMIRAKAKLDAIERASLKECCTNLKTRASSPMSDRLKTQLEQRRLRALQESLEFATAEFIFCKEDFLHRISQRRLGLNPIVPMRARMQIVENFEMRVAQIVEKRTFSLQDTKLSKLESSKSKALRLPHQHNPRQASVQREVSVLEESGIIERIPFKRTASIMTSALKKDSKEREKISWSRVKIAQPVVLTELLRSSTKVPEVLETLSESSSVGSAVTVTRDLSVNNAVCSTSSEDDDYDDEVWEYYEEDSDESKPAAVNKTQSTFNIPASLLTRWDYTIWDSDEDEESEEEEVDEMSPYNQSEIKVKVNYQPTHEIADWLALISESSSKLFRQMNSDFHKRKRLCKAKKEKSTVKEGILKEDLDEEVMHRLQESRYCSGVQHGFSRIFHGNAELIKACGWYEKGCKKGVWWERMQGNSYLVEIYDLNNPDGLHNGCFLFPNLYHAFVGTFSKGKMVSGRFGYLNDVEFIDGVPYPRVQITDSANLYANDFSTSLRISSTPLVRDPYEHLLVYVAQSNIPDAGEGLFAKTHLDDGCLIALFNGLRKIDFQRAKSTFSDYKIGLTRDVYLDISSNLSRLNNYCATLGHKCCHSFVPNAEFTDFFHPRFGHIMSIVAKRDIRRGEEILVSYNYSLPTAPVWYRDLFFQHLRYQENKSEEYIYSVAKKINTEYGMSVKVKNVKKIEDFEIEYTMKFTIILESYLQKQR